MVSGVIRVPIPAPLQSSPASDQAAGELYGDYIAGPENRLSAELLRTIRELPPYNPLVIHGPRGAGKSHLAMGLALSLSGDRQPASIVTFSAKDLQKSLAGKRPPPVDQFKLKVLVVKDVHDLASRRSSDHRLCDFLDALASHVDEQGEAVRVIVTSRVAPADLPGLSGRLRSRLAAGLQIGLALPGPEARNALNVQVDCSGRLVKRIARPTNRSSALRDEFIDKIARQTARYFSVPVADLRGPSRRRTVALARAVAMYLARQHGNATLAAIGKHFGGRDHTTVMHSCQKIETLLTRDAATRQAVAELEIF